MSEQAEPVGPASKIKPNLDLQEPPLFKIVYINDEVTFELSPFGVRWQLSLEVGSQVIVLKDEGNVRKNLSCLLPFN